MAWLGFGNTLTAVVPDHKMSLATTEDTQKLIEPTTPVVSSETQVNEPPVQTPTVSAVPEKKRGRKKSNKHKDKH